MKRIDIAMLIACGLRPSSMFKRSVWNKVKLIMDYLVNTGKLEKRSGEIKYGSIDGHAILEDEMLALADFYMASPFCTHLEELKQLSKKLRLPLTSGELLQAYMNI